MEGRNLSSVAPPLRKTVKWLLLHVSPQLLLVQSLIFFFQTWLIAIKILCLALAVTNAPGN